MKRAISATSVLLVALALTGCGGGLAADSSTAASPAAVATTTVDLPKSYRFEPPAITVDVGATVTWTNHDEFTHNVTFESDAALVMKPGESVTRAFPTPGTYAYFCSLHPKDMQGSITVEEN
jgi:plastocyanin